MRKKKTKKILFIFMKTANAVLPAERKRGAPTKVYDIWIKGKIGTLGKTSKLTKLLWHLKIPREDKISAAIWGQNKFKKKKGPTCPDKKNIYILAFFLEQNTQKRTLIRKAKCQNRKHNCIILNTKVYRFISLIVTQISKKKQRWFMIPVLTTFSCFLLPQQLNDMKTY